MKRLGLIGGMSWESTVSYYQAINRGVATRLGGLHSADLVLRSVDFAPVEILQRGARWDEAGDLLAGVAAELERAGAEAIVLCTNTMHRVASAIEQAVAVPLLHIVDATGAAITAKGIDRVGLLGTRFTMEEDFYRGKLEREHDLAVLVPDSDERAEVDRIIYEELCLGRIESSSRDTLAEIVASLAASGARGIILGCTEIGLLLSSGDVDVPLFDTTRLHADAAVDFMLAT